MINESVYILAFRLNFDYFELINTGIGLSTCDKSPICPLSGQVGNRDKGSYIKIPAFVLISSNFVKAYAGNNNTCGIDSESNTSRCGYNTYGQLGNGESCPIPNPPISGATW